MSDWAVRKRTVWNVVERCSSSLNSESQMTWYIFPNDIQTATQINASVGNCRGCTQTKSMKSNTFHNSSLYAAEPILALKVSHCFFACALGISIVASAVNRRKKISQTVLPDHLEEDRPQCLPFCIKSPRHHSAVRDFAKKVLSLWPNDFAALTPLSSPPWGLWSLKHNLVLLDLPVPWAGNAVRHHAWGTRLSWRPTNS